MTAPLFRRHPGTHQTPPGPVVLFFRRVLRRSRRKQAPGALTPGARALLAASLAVPPEHRGFMRWVDLSVPVPDGWGAEWRGNVRVLVPPVPVDGHPPWETAPFAPVPAQPRRPVNGRSRPSQPRQQPVYGEVPQLRMAGQLDETQAEIAREQMRQAMYTRDPGVLRQVLAALKRDGRRTETQPIDLGRNGWQ